MRGLSIQFMCDNLVNEKTETKGSDWYGKKAAKHF